MKNIAVLIDYTEGSKVALQQAAGIAEKMQGNLFGIHLVSSLAKVKEAEETLKQWMHTHVQTGVQQSAIVAEGSLVQGTLSALKKAEADLVIICTHGVKGMFQHLFGAQILKLVQALPYPCIVIQEHIKANLSKAEKILLPIGPHPDFMLKIKQTAALAKILGASVVIYEIDRPGTDFENQLSKNADIAKNYLVEQGIAYTRVTEEAKVLSIGFSRQTIEYAANNQIPILSLMASVSKNDTLFGFGDKENFLVNEQGVSVLTCNA